MQNTFRYLIRILSLKHDCEIFRVWRKRPVVDPVWSSAVYIPVSPWHWLLSLWLWGWMRERVTLIYSLPLFPIRTGYICHPIKIWKQIPETSFYGPSRNAVKYKTIRRKYLVMSCVFNTQIKSVSPENTALKPDEAWQQDWSLTEKVSKHVAFSPATLLMKSLFSELQLFFKDFSYTKFLIFSFLFVDLKDPFFPL